MRKTATALAVMLGPMLLAACESRPQFASYYVDRACTASGVARGAADYEACVAGKRLDQATSIYDLAGRAATREPSLIH